MYNKLFSKIVTSSIWLEPTPTRMIWITFLALMDESGFAPVASVANLAHTARISLEDTTKAVEILESPDENSGDKDNDGRRIERVPGGWMVLNAKKYRDIVTRANALENTRNRVAAFRSRKRTGTTEKINEQGGKCGCCGLDFETPFSLYVVQDHCHRTGKMRDLICQSCNKVVGLIERGKPYGGDKFDICTEYVKRHSNDAVTLPTGNARVTPSESYAVSESESDTHKNSYVILESVKAAYPAGTFGAQNWILAERAIGKLLESGETEEAIVAAALAYREQMDAKGSTGTQYIRSPEKFYGDGFWRGPFPKPEPKKSKSVADHITYRPTE